MPGRQAHGRPLTSKSATKPSRKSKSKSRAHALDAFSIAAKQVPSTEKPTPRSRHLEDSEAGPKHKRHDPEDDGEEEDEPQRKRPRPSRGSLPVADDDVEFGSDSEGNEWQLGGLGDDDDDSEIDSDEAFGESDEERFEGFTFRGGKSSGGNESDGNEEDLDDDDGNDSLGSEAIDIAQALDQSDNESIEDGVDSDSDSDSGSSPPSSNGEDDDEDTADETKLGTLESLVTEFAERNGKGETGGPKQKQKLSLKDLGLFGVKDPHMKKSMKLMSKEERETKPGATRKLDIPLAKRQQDKILRTAAYEKANQTLDRWTETVKHNRRAEHLIFPLPQNLPGAGLDNGEIRPLTVQNASNELEQTIMSIVEQSGLTPKSKESQQGDGDDDGQAISRAGLQAMWNERRRERELNSRETKRAKRIKKIKSKAYHRVHRKARQKEEMAVREALEAAGEIDSEAEREAQDRKRALERVGARHRDSKWAKTGAKTKRAVWDEDFRAGVHEMAQMDEELRKRKEGRATSSSSDSDGDSDLDASSESGEGNVWLQKQLEEAEERDDGQPESKLMQLRFMKRAENALKKANDEMVEQLRKELASDHIEEPSEEEVEVGRRSYGTAKSKTLSAPSVGIVARQEKETDEITQNDRVAALKPDWNGIGRKSGLGTIASITAEPIRDPTKGAWSQGEPRRKSKKSSSSQVEDLDLNAAIMVAERTGKPGAKATGQRGADDGQPADDDPDIHLPLAIRDQEMVARAFAGEDVVGEFEREKEQIAEDDDDKIVDNTLPGWGSWVGEGVSKREQERHKGRFLTKVEGVKKKDRKDAKLERVIISERRTKKNDRYLASQLPHPFESREQYERSLRLPVGPEWMTKETLQDSTKPRILLKQGIITPISKPIL